MSNYYAVAIGSHVGIYTSWDAAKVNVIGYSGSKHKKFSNLKDAEEYIQNNRSTLNASSTNSQQYNISTPSAESSSAPKSIPTIESTKNLSKVSIINNTASKEIFPDESCIHIYTDGSHKEKRGGVGVAYVYNEKVFDVISHKMEEYPTTNNRAELLAIYMGLFKVNIKDPPNYKYKLYTDSEYSVNIFNSFLSTWSKNGYRTASGEPVKNMDLISGISDLLTKIRMKTSIDIIWVKSHADNKFNNLVDELAKKGRDMI